MKLQALINKLQKIHDKNGNVDVFTEEGHLIRGANFSTIEEDDYLEEWNMPKKAVLLKTDS